MWFIGSTLAVTACFAQVYLDSKGVTFPLLCRMRSEVLASGHKQASPWCTWDERKQFSRHDVKCSVESRAWSFLLSAAARSFKASPEPLGQGIVWPLCVLKLFEHLNRKWFITGLQHRTYCACTITTSHLHHSPACGSVWVGHWNHLATRSTPDFMNMDIPKTD